MSDIVENGETYTEKFDKYKVRLLAHELLENVTFNGEPVVPRILSKSSDIVDTNGNTNNSFEVEELGEINLRHVVSDKEVAPIDKLKIIHHVIGQLQVIDQAGIVLFDRAGRNIVVPKFGSDGISTRQVDLEEFWSKKDNQFYSSGSFNGEKADFYAKNGFDLWGETVAHLSNLTADAVKDTDSNLAQQFVRKYTFLAWGEYDEHIKSGKKKSPRPLSSQDTLSVLKKDIEKTISKFVDKESV